MTALQIVSQITAGFRVALILFAVMAMLAWYANGGEKTALERYRRRSWGLLSISVLAYSPAHAAWLMGHPFAKIISHLMDAAASAAACGCFITLLASRGLMRGLTEARVRRGVHVNLFVLAASVGAAWLTR